MKREDGQGASIGSRWPIDRVHEVDLNVTPRTADFACTTPVAEIAAPEPFGPLVFVDHVPSWQLQYEQERELQALAAARFVEELAGERHVISAGDFSADPDSAGVRFLTGRQSLDGRASATAMPGSARTQPSRARPRRRGTPSSTTGTGRSGGSTTSSSAAASTAGRRSPSPTAPSVFDEPADGVWASDHFGVVADLEPPPR